MGDPDAPLHTIAANPLILYEAIGELRKYSFMRRNTQTKTLSLHRLVQVYLKEMMTREEQRCGQNGRCAWSTMSCLICPTMHSPHGRCTRLTYLMP